MAKISLHKYLDKVNQLLDENQFGDAAQHCLHILKQYPRHLNTYRALAKALLGQRKHSEAIEIFQRVLSAEPNDLLAHIALSDLHRTEMQVDLSNQHLQRALEIEPYNEAIQAEYRDVFALDDDEDFASARIPLNGAALGNLYLRGELFDQATAVLRKTLAESPERIDQELLLAEALWRDGDFNEAEVVSQRVLEQLPNCLTANAILSDIWLRAERVSDAQPFLRRVQSMVQLDQEHAEYDSAVGCALAATGSPSLPNEIMLQMWDETAVLATKQEPTADWVNEISFGDGAESDAITAEPAIESEPADMFGWLKGVSSESRDEVSSDGPESPKQDPAKGEIDWFVDNAAEETPSSPAEKSVTDWLGGEWSDPADDEADEVIHSPLPDWMSKERQDPVNQEMPAIEDEPADMPDWLNEVAEEDFEPMQFNPESASQWLAEPDADGFDEAEAEAEVDEAADWLAELSGEIDELTSAPLDPDVLGLDADEGESETAVSDDSMGSDTTDWLNGLSFDDQGDSDDHWLAAISPDDSAKDEIVSDLDIQSEDAEALSSDDSNWLEDITDSADEGSNESEDWLGVLDAAPVETIAETGDLAEEDDWLADLADGEELFDSPPPTTSQVEEEPTSFDSEDLLAALAGDDSAAESDADLFDSIADDDPLTDDWLAALAGDEFEKVADFQDEPASAEDDVDDDWLAELEKGTSLPSSDPNEAASDQQISQTEAQAEDEAEDEYEEASLTAWLSDGNGLFEDEVQEMLEEAEESDELSLTALLSGDEIESLEADVSETTDEAESVDPSLTALLSGDDAAGLDNDTVEEMAEEASEEVDDSLADVSLTAWLSGEDVEELDDAPSEPAASDDVEMSVTDWLSEDALNDIEDLESADMSSPNDEKDEEQKDLPEHEQEKSSDDDLMDWLEDLSDSEKADEDKLVDELAAETTDSSSDLLEPDQAELPEWLSRKVKSEEAAVSVESEADIPDWLQESDELPSEQALSEFNMDSTFEGTTEPPDPSTSLLDELQPPSQEPTESLPVAEDVSWLNELSESDDGLDDTSALGWLDEDKDTDSLLDWMDDVDDAEDAPVEAEEPEEIVAETADVVETAVSDEDDGDFLPPDASPSDLDDAMSWLDDLGIEDAAPVEPLPTVADVLDEGLTDLFEEEDAQPVSEVDESADPEADADLDFLEQELFGLADEDEVEQPAAELDVLSEIEADSDADLDFLEQELFSLADEGEDEQPAAEAEDAVNKEIDSDLDQMFEPNLAEDLLDLDSSGFEEVDLEEIDDVESDSLPQTESTESTTSEPEPMEFIGKDDGFTEELAELDEAMSWLDQMGDTGVLFGEVDIDAQDDEPEPVKESDTYADVLEEAGLSVQDEDFVIDEVVAEPSEDFDDSIAWLEDLAEKSDAPLDDELPTLVSGLEPLPDEAPVSEVVPDEPVVDLDPDLAAALDWLDETIEVEEDVDEAETAVFTTTSDADLLAALDQLEQIALEPVTPAVEEEISEPKEVSTEEASPVEEIVAEAADEDLLMDGIFDMPDDPDDALAWLQDMSDETVVEEMEVETAVPDTTDLLDEEAAPVEETTAEAADEDSLMDGVFDMPDDPDDALAWLQDMSDEAVIEETAVETAVPDTLVIEPDDEAEPEDAAEEPIPKKIDVSEDESDALSALNMFDMPDDPDAALAWLEEGDVDDMPLVEEPATTMVIEPEEIAELASEPEEASAEEALPDADDAATSDFDDLFGEGAFDMPDDPDAALAWLEEMSDAEVPTSVAEPMTPMIEEATGEEPDADDDPDAVETEAGEVDLDADYLAEVPEDPDAAVAWLEQLAARQGASLDELPSVSEQPDEIDTPDWIAAAAEEELVAETAVSDPTPDIADVLEEIEPEHTLEEDEGLDLSELDDFLIDNGLSDIPDDEDVDEAMPSWLASDEDDAVEIPGQTDWLSELPEPDASGWLAAEAEASGTAQLNETGPLPETGPLFESVVSDTAPLEADPVPEPKGELPSVSKTDELSASMFQIDEEQLDLARASLLAGESVEALSIYRSLVSQGGGLMMLINELETVSSDFPQERELRRLLGDAYMRNGQLQKALTAYRETLDQL